MKLVDMNEVVFDQAQLAFPGLANCHGVVYVTDVGMFAYHAAGNPDDSEGKAAMFGSFVKGHRHRGAQGLGLFGYCPTNRHDKDSSHKRELKMIAGHLGFEGAPRGFRWNVATLGWHSTYLDVVFNAGVIVVTIENLPNPRQITEHNNDDWQDHKYVSQAKYKPDDPSVAKLTTRKDVTWTCVRNGGAQTVQAQKL